MRAFVAIPLEPEARGRIAAAVAPLAGRGRSVRWVRAENLHLTLAFLGDIDEALVPRIDERLAAVAASTAAQEVRLAGVGGFPSARPHVLWLGLDAGRPWFVTLARSVGAALAEGLGLVLDQREPAAHVTLARVGRPDRALVPALAAVFTDAAIASRADRMTLFSSVLGPGGPTYRVEREWPFSAPVAESAPR